MVCLSRPHNYKKVFLRIKISPETALWSSHGHRIFTTHTKSERERWQKLQNSPFLVLEYYKIVVLQHYKITRGRGRIGTFPMTNRVRLLDEMVSCKTPRIWCIQEMFFSHMGRFARFGKICTILKTWKTPMEKCY